MLEGVSTFSFLLAIILLLVLIILLTLFAILVYSGLFTAIEDVGTGKPPVGQLIIAYKFQRGPYNEAGQLFTEACIIAPENQAIGIYYDDPNKVDSQHLRYAVGSIIAEKEAPVDEAMVKRFTENGFKIIHLPEVTYAVQTKFPHITTLSILIAVRKAYPMLQSYVEEHKLCAHPFMEYYDGKTIHFFAPLSKQDEFYVPECNAGLGGGGGEDVPTAGETTADVSSSSNLSVSHGADDSQGGLDLTVTSVDSNTSLEDEKDTDGKEEEEGEPTSDLASQLRESSAKETVADIGKNADVEGPAADEDQVSDDSTSSFEVVKKDA